MLTGLRPKDPRPSSVDVEALTQRIARGASIAFTGSAVGNGLSLVLQVLLGRMLGARGYGLYYLGYGMLTTLQWGASLGLDWGVLRFCAQYRGVGKDGHVKGTLLAAVLGSAISSAAVAAVWFAFAHPIGVGVFHDPELGPVLRAFAIALPLFVLLRILAAFVQSLNQLLAMTVLQNVALPGITLILAAVALHLGFGLRGAIAALIAALVVSVALGARYVARLFPDMRHALRPECSLGELLTYSTRLMLLGLAWQLLLRVDALILGYFANARSVGIYGAAATSASVLTTVAVAFSASMAPSMADLYHRGRIGELREVYRTIVRWNLILMLALLPVVFFLAGTIMKVFGKEFAGADPILWLLALSWFLYFCKGPASMLMDMTGWQTVDLINTVAAVALTTGLCLWLVPGHGMLGAAIATTITRFVLSVVETIEIYVLFRVVPFGWHSLVPVLVLGVVMTGEFLFVAHLGPVIVVGAGLIAYAVLCWVACLAEWDRQVVRSIVRRVLGATHRVPHGT